MISLIIDINVLILLGPISLTLYITDSELQEIGSYLNTMSILKRRSNVAFHVVFKKGVSDSYSF